MKMNGEDIFKALENTDESFLEECQKDSGGAKIVVWKKWVAVAACAALAVSSTVVYLNNKTKGPIKTGAYQYASQNDKEAADNSENALANVDVSADSEYMTDSEYWDSVDNYLKYNTIEYNGHTYVSFDAISSDWCEKKLDSKSLQTDNFEGKTETTKADVYTIKGVSENAAVALKFDDGNTASYFSQDYRPVDFLQLADDLGFENSVVLDRAYRSDDADTEYVYRGFGSATIINMFKAINNAKTEINRFDIGNDDIDSFDPSQITEGSTDDEALTADESTAQTQITTTATAVTVAEDPIVYDDNLSIYGSIERLGIYDDFTILFSNDGYMDIIIGNTTYSYYLGVEGIEFKLIDLVDYLENNSVKSKVGIDDSVYTDDGEAVENGQTTTATAVTDTPQAGEEKLMYIDPDNLPSYANKRSNADGWYDIPLDVAAENTYVSKDAAVTVKCSYEVVDGKLHIYENVTNNTDHDMTLSAEQGLEYSASADVANFQQADPVSATLAANASNTFDLTFALADIGDAKSFSLKLKFNTDADENGNHIAYSSSTPFKFDIN